MNNAPAFRLQFSKIEKQVRVCEFSNRTLFLLFHLPLKIVQRLDMPKALACDGAEGQRAEKVDEEDFRYVKKLSFAERFKLPTVTPIIDCSFGVAGQGDNLLHDHDILIFAEQFGVIVVHLLQHILRQFLGELRHIMAAVPSPRCGIKFGVNGSLLKVRPDILFFDFIAPCFLTCPLAGHLAAFEQMQCRGFTDMAEPIKLILIHHIGHAVPVNR